jgi:predicted RNase H-like HicB family nuclease
MRDILDATLTAPYIHVRTVGANAMTPYHVNAELDEEAAVWVASSEDVPGLATGADTLEALIEKLKVVIPELLEANGLLAAGIEDVPFAIKAEWTERARRVA